MPTLNITKTYADETVLTKTQLDTAFDSVSNFVNTTKLGSDNLNTGSVGTTQVIDASITTAKLANNAVTDAKLSSSNTDDTARAVGTNHIKDAAVTNVKIADATIDHSKLAARGSSSSATAGQVAISSGSGNYSTTSGSYTDVTNLSVSLVTLGGPVSIRLIPDSANPNSNTLIFCSGSSFAYQFLRSGTPLGNCELTGLPSGVNITPVGGIATVDFPSAGTYTYKLQVHSNGGSGLTVRDVKLVAYEL